MSLFPPSFPGPMAMAAETDPSREGILRTSCPDNHPEVLQFNNLYTPIPINNTEIPRIPNLLAPIPYLDPLFRIVL